MLIFNFAFKSKRREKLKTFSSRRIAKKLSKKFISKDEFRIIFDYFKVKKTISSAYMKLSSKVHDILFDLRHDVLFMTDFK